VAEPERIDAILDRMTSRMGLSARLEREKALILWKEAVGSNVARRTAAMSIRGGRLVVVVKDSTWLQELSLLKEDIIERLNSLLGKRIVEDLILRIGDPARERGEENSDGSETQPQERRRRR
jgi:predicted nucleic acid-binding Zn ribbon protein